VLVGDNGEISDISKGSSAMKEVIDLAFKLVAMKYLNLQTHPVYLDEFAKTLDYEHRKTAHKTIVDLITNANFSQLFIINHYNDLYGGLVNSEITVLHSANIVMPAQMVNTHVIMR
jgi:DNA repair exonuclease SbcCD ATPase subunit